MSAVLAPHTTTILMPGDPGWDDARRAWNLSVDQHPAAIALPASAQDVVAAVDYARERGLRVAAQGTGHNAAARSARSRTPSWSRRRRMRQVTVDPAARTARAEAGVVWQRGHRGRRRARPGGASRFLPGRRRGGLHARRRDELARPRLRAGGEQRRGVRAGHRGRPAGPRRRGTEPDLFWALRGGGGSFGVVTATELRLFPVAEVYAGLLWWPTRGRDGAAGLAGTDRQPGCPTSSPPRPR